MKSITLKLLLFVLLIALGYVMSTKYWPRDLLPKYELVISLNKMNEEKILSELKEIGVVNKLNVDSKSYPRLNGDGKVIYLTMDSNALSVVATNLDADKFLIIIRDSFSGQHCIKDCLKIKTDIENRLGDLVATSK